LKIWKEKGEFFVSDLKSGCENKVFSPKSFTFLTKYIQVYNGFLAQDTPSGPAYLYPVLDFILYRRSKFKGVFVKFGQIRVCIP
jgi:hypothetical protein